MERTYPLAMPTAFASTTVGPVTEDVRAARAAGEGSVTLEGIAATGRGLLLEGLVLILIIAILPG